MRECIPLLVPFESGAVFEAEDPPEGASGTPLAVLSFEDHPHAELAFRALMHDGIAEALVVSASAWVEMGTAPENQYEEAHAAHPLVRFLVEPALEGPGAPVETVAFLVCVMCDGFFLRAVTRSDELGLIAATLDDSDPSDPTQPLDFILPAAVDPGQIATAELWAWRRAFRRAEWPKSGANRLP
jgi:hypothetical protein